MKAKTFMLIGALLGILLLAMFGSGLKEKVVNGMAENVEGYSCDGGICTTCMIDGEKCSCGDEVCTCGSKTVDAAECSLFR